MITIIVNLVLEGFIMMGLKQLREQRKLVGKLTGG